MRILSLRNLFIWGAGALMLTIALSVWVFNDSLFRAYMDPRIPFEVDIPPETYIYENSSGWYEIQLNEGLMTTGAQSENQPEIFILMPTANFDRRSWNGHYKQDQIDRLQFTSYIPNFAGPFYEHGNIWVPKIRQASLYAMQIHKEEARSAIGLAAEDARESFSTFLNQTGEAPVILVGVGQGALLAQSILFERRNDHEFHDRLLAVYLQDSALLASALEQGGALSNYEICKSPEQVRCIISFFAHQLDHEEEISNFLDRGYSWTDDGPTNIDDRRIVCVNPLLWISSEDFAPKRLHRGAVNATGMSLSDKLPAMSGTTSAQCKDGILLIEPQRHRNLRKGFSFGSKFKPDQYNLFYADIAHNVVTRIENWVLKNTPPPLVEEAIEDSQIHKVPTSTP